MTLRRARMLARGTVAVLLGIGAAGPPARAAGLPGQPEIHLGLDAWSGDTTYRIGGRFSMNGETAVLPMPLSELEWPMDITLLEAGLRLRPLPRWDLRLRGAVSVTEDAGLLKDSDWELPELLPGVVTTYSEAQTRLQAEEEEVRLGFDVGRLQRGRVGARAQAGLGWLHRKTTWKSLRGVQESIFQDEPIVFDREGIITYETTFDLPYADAAVQFALHKLTLDARCGWSPLARVRDRDDHRARGILAETDADGNGLLTELAASWAINARWSLSLAYRRMDLSADGTSRNVDYAGQESAAGTRWDIHEEIEIRQDSWTLALACRL